MKIMPENHYQIYIIPITKANPIIHNKSIMILLILLCLNLCFYNKAPCTNYEIKNLNYKKIANYGVLYIK